MGLNIELATRLVKRFRRMRHPEHFNMKPIAAKTDCGTVMCVAGHTLDLAGYKMRLDPYRAEGDYIYDGRTDFDFISPAGRKVSDPLIAAAKELGLKPTWGEGGAYDLFHDYSLKTPKDAAEAIQGMIDAART